MRLNITPSTIWTASTDGGERWRAIAVRAIAAGTVAYTLHIAIRSLLTAGVDPVDSAQATLWVPVNALGAVGASLALLGMPAILGPRVDRESTRELVGIALLASSWMLFGVFLSLYGAMVMPWLANQAPELLSSSAATPAAFSIAFALGLLAWLAGATLLALPFLQGASHPRWAGALLPVSALWFLFGSFVIAPDGPAGNLASNLVSNLGPVLLLIALTAVARSGRHKRDPLE